MGDPEALFQTVDQDALVDLVRRMVQIPSINPPGDYQRIASLLEGEMEGAGLRTVILAGQPGKTNVFGLLPGGPDARKTLLLSGHMDVVGPGDASGWRFDPFSATLADGAIWGRGTVDMKGAVAAQSFALKALRQAGPERLPINVMLGATVDDETGGPMGCRYVIEQGLDSVRWPRPTLHVLGEANSLNITGAFKGRIWLSVTLQGKSAHGGAPETGVNAVEKMFDLYRQLRELGTRRHPVLGPDTLNLGTISGGARVNVVPDECTADFDYRTGGLTAEEAERRIRAVIGRLESLDRAFVVKELRVYEKRDSIGIEPDAPEIRVIGEAVSKATKRAPRFLGSLSAGDAYYTLKQGIPAVWVGPGDPSLLHAPNEHILIEDLLAAVKVYIAIILAYGRT